MNASRYWAEYKKNYHRMLGIHLTAHVNVYGVDDLRITEETFNQANADAAEITQETLRFKQSLPSLYGSCYGEVSA